MLSNESLQFLKIIIAEFTKLSYGLLRHKTNTLYLLKTKQLYDGVKVFYWLNNKLRVQFLQGFNFGGHMTPLIF